MEQKDVMGEETDRREDDKEGNDSATVAGPGDVSRLEHGREGSAVAGVGGKGATVDEAA